MCGSKDIGRGEEDPEWVDGYYEERTYFKDMPRDLDTVYVAWFIGTLLCSSPYSSGSASGTIINNRLTSTYLKWATKNPSYGVNDNYSNICAVAYMMDTSKWANFAGNSYMGSFAIGGPTIELFVKSYNAKHSGETTELGEYDTNGFGRYGYLVTFKKNNDYWNSYYITLNTSDSMWVKTSQERANGYWLASPSSSANYEVRAVNYDGNLSYRSFNNDGAGFRPLVCIPKTSI